MEMEIFTVVLGLSRMAALTSPQHGCCSLPLRAPAVELVFLGMPGAAKSGCRVKAESPSPKDDHAVSLHYHISFICRSWHALNVLMKSSTIPGRSEIV